VGRFIQVSLNLRRHPKVARLCSKLQSSTAWAYVIDLWMWCVEYAPDGDLSRYSAEEVEFALGWTLDPGVLFAALRTCGFIEDKDDGRMVIHDWEEHQGKWLAKLDDNRRRIRKWRKAKAKADAGVTRTELVRNGNERDNRREDKTREDKRTVTESSEPLRATEPVVLIFPVVGDPKVTDWGLTKSVLSELEKAFPGVDVRGQCEKARVWLNANPTRRKTARGMYQFLFSWVERVQNRGGSGPVAINGTPANGVKPWVAAERAEEARKREEHNAATRARREIQAEIDAAIAAGGVK
jgi:hypothetical protein